MRATYCVTRSVTLERSGGRVIFIAVKHPVKPEYADNWTSLVAEFTTATRAEPGNLFFDWFRSVEDPNTFLLVEAFRDGAAGAEHVNSQHFQAAIAALPNWLAATPEIVNVEVPSDGWLLMAEVTIE
jgi:quinol monooxygenase YgiN